MNETLLLVGETGTGKTTIVQNIANIIGKKLNVFNMSQNTDSADLMGGFKPIDTKFLLKPLYVDFLSLFNSLLDQTQNRDFIKMLVSSFNKSKNVEFFK
jgi:midasin